jgi:AraC family transcriptional regulator
MGYLQTDERRSALENGYLAVWDAHLPTIERVVQTMRERLCESFSLEDMADVACLSPFYFSRVFHQIIGAPPGEFLSTLRLDMAKRLLLTTSLSVTDICFEVGYNALGSFTTRFTQQVGLPPRHLRHLARNVPLRSFVELCDPPPLLLPYAKGVGGRILSTGPFDGLIFAGLFPKAIPQGRPIRCTLLAEPGPYHIDFVPDGRYFLLVAALPVSKDPYTYLLPHNDVLVGIKGPLTVHNGGAQDTVDVILRPPRLTDPPIISALPFI